MRQAFWKRFIFFKKNSNVIFSNKCHFFFGDFKSKVFLRQNILHYIIRKIANC